MTALHPDQPKSDPLSSAALALLREAVALCCSAGVDNQARILQQVYQALADFPYPGWGSRQAVTERLDKIAFAIGQILRLVPQYAAPSGAHSTGEPEGAGTTGELTEGDPTEATEASDPGQGVDPLVWLESVNGSLCWADDGRIKGWIVVMPEDGDREEWRLAAATPAGAIGAAMAAHGQQQREAR